jgi:hypothetical protein
MKEVYRYRFEDDVPLDDVEESLLLAVLAAECLHGQARVRLNAGYCFDKKRFCCIIDASTTVGQTISKLFTGFCIREFGEDSFKVERLDGPPPAKGAIRFEHFVREGQVHDYANLARLGHVTRARLTQIMNLRLLAPDIQEAILFLPRVPGERSGLCERHVRKLVATPDWAGQRRLWKLLCQKHQLA